VDFLRGWDEQDRPWDSRGHLLAFNLQDLVDHQVWDEGDHRQALEEGNQIMRSEESKSKLARSQQLQTSRIQKRGRWLEARRHRHPVRRRSYYGPLMVGHGDARS
jgi:hypothetical protein